jgi:flagellar basal-body rod protein FlgF
MPYGIYLSAAGANAQNQRLEVLSHNLANVNTPGFKPQLAVLQATHAEEIERGQISQGSGTFADISGGVSMDEVKTVYSQGPMQQTKRQTDFAINDNSSYFVVQRGEQQLLTRAGGFLFNSQGMLTTTNGDPVISTGGNPIQIDPNRDFTVHDDGRIAQAGTTFTIKLARPQQPGDLSRVGDNFFKPLAEPQAVPQNERRVRSGFLEQSAVKPTGAMMELIEASRLYEANLKMIQTQDQAMGGLIGRLLRDS